MLGILNTYIRIVKQHLHEVKPIVEMALEKYQILDRWEFWAISYWVSLMKIQKKIQMKLFK